MLRRVVITGLGLVTPLGCGVEASWSRLIAGQSGARRIEEFDGRDLACQIGCFVPRGRSAEGKFNPDDWMEPKEQRKVDDFIIYAHGRRRSGFATMPAGRPIRPEKQERTGVMIGSGIGGLTGIAETSISAEGKRPAPGQPVLHPRPADQSGLRATSRSGTASRAPTTPSSPPARRVRTPSATPRD